MENHSICIIFFTFSPLPFPAPVDKMKKLCDNILWKNILPAVKNRKNSEGFTRARARNHMVGFAIICDDARRTGAREDQADRFFFIVSGAADIRRGENTDIAKKPGDRK